MKKALIFVTLILVLVGATLALRTAQMTSRQMTAPATQPMPLDETRLLNNLSAALRYRTIAEASSNTTSKNEFERLHEFLKRTFPNVEKALAKEVIGGGSLLYTWSGSNPELKPILFAAHMDVVPVEASSEKRWTHPPFSGTIANGYVWGRGSMDDKASMMALLETVEALLASGFTPQRTIYFAFGHDEEIGGDHGAAKIAQHLRDQGVKLAFALDEGGNITDGIVAGTHRPVALIGIAEKGYVSLELQVNSLGGHSSVPPPESAIGVLAGAVQRLERHPLPTRLSPALEEFFAYLGPELDWPQRVAIANRWLFEPLVKRELAKSHLSAALVRTTQAPTIFHAGTKENVLPTDARAVINYRILHGDSIKSVVAHVRNTIDDPRVEIRPLALRLQPSPIAHTDSDSFRSIQKVLARIAPEVIAAPALLVAATDARHYAALTDNVYRFLPITLTAEDAPRYHGVDERIAIADYLRLIRFYRLLIDQAGR